MVFLNNIFITLQKMLKDRNYDTNDLQSKELTNDKSMFDFQISHNLTKNTIKVFYLDDGKIGINHLKGIVNNLNELNIQHVLIIHEDAITSFAKQYIVSQNDIKFETFYSKELINNITEHDLVPQHICLSVEEKNQFLNAFKIKERNLPRMLRSDPIARYHGCNPGTLIKILRNDDNISSITYRIVV